MLSNISFVLGNKVSRKNAFEIYCPLVLVRLLIFEWGEGGSKLVRFKAKIEHTP